ncbi:MAG TPA: DCC1-like thiol-disulfide oxidoreductase family protein [Ohtaekwangia sp.]|nr:DCC1-like thiol-disulfide oxidoreductase family protein [Ohtaekwangia sp.]
MNSDPHILILFDGVCNLCNAAVNFIIKRDAAAKFKFASLQSNRAKYELNRFRSGENTLHSVILIDGDTIYKESDAVLRIAAELGMPWSFFRIFKILPRKFRNALYNVLARNRYRLFGRKSECMIPTPELKSRFLDQ